MPTQLGKFPDDSSYIEHSIREKKRVIRLHNKNSINNKKNINNGNTKNNINNKNNTINK